MDDDFLKLRTILGTRSLPEVPHATEEPPTKCARESANALAAAAAAAAAAATTAAEEVFVNGADDDEGSDGDSDNDDEADDDDDDGDNEDIYYDDDDDDNDDDDDDGDNEDIYYDDDDNDDDDTFDEDDEDDGDGSKESVASSDRAVAPRDEEARIACPYAGCTRRFKTMARFKVHEPSHTGAKLYQCMKCSARFSSRSSCTRHERTHDKNKGRVCRFAGCGKYLASISSYTIHMRDHTGEKPYVCSVDGCHESFAQIPHRQRHELKVHRVSPFVCAHAGCGKMFATKCELTVHTRFHSREKRYRCTLGCDKVFTTAGHQREHEKLAHIRYGV